MDFVNDDGENICPLCAEEMDLTDRQLKPCQCGYEICVLCWHHLMEVAEKDNTEGRCPACRTPYDKEKIVGTAVNCERLKDANSEKRQKSQKSKARTSEMRKHLSNVRVIQRNLVYIVGIPASLADEEVLERREYFGRYGKVLKVSISRSSASSQQSTSNPTTSVYITYVKEEEAIRCIQAVNGFVLDGRPLRACFGTTKYCHAWLKNMPCNNPDCLYLHDIGTQEDSFTKEEMVSTCASKIQQFHGLTNPSHRRGGSCLPPPEPDVCSTNSTSSSKPSVKMAASVRTAVTNGTTGKATVLPAAASWGSRAAQGRTLPTKAPAVLVPTKLKSSSSHTLSVSPPSNLPSSAAVVAAAAVVPELHSDHSKLSLVVLSSNAAQSSERSACSIPAKSNVLKNPNTTRTNSATSAGVDASAANSTSERYIRQTSPQKKFAGSNPYPKCGIQENIERASYNSLSNSALSSNSHLDGAVETEISDCISVSSELIDRRLCSKAFKTIHDDYDKISTLVLNEKCKRSDSHIHITKPPFDIPSSCSNSSQIENKADLETSMVASIKNVCIMDSEDPCHPKELEEHSGSFDQIPSGSRRKTKIEPASEDNRRHLGSQASTNLPVVCSPAGGTMITGGSHSISLNDRDISTASPIKTSNFDISKCDDSKNGMVDERTEGFSSFGLISATCSAPPCTESSMDKDGISTVSLQSSEKAYQDCFRIDKSEGLENLQNYQSSTRNNIDTDAGENSIISNILSLDFDVWEEDNSIASPHNLAKVLLGEKDTNTGFLKDTSSSWKFQNSGQSRFSFAREDDSKNESSNFSSCLTSNGQLQNTRSKGREVLDVRNGYDQFNTSLNDASACNRDEFQIFTNRYTSISSSEATVTPISSSRAQLSAPPGFSLPTRIPPVPPPGFSPQLRADRPYESTAGSVFSNGTQDHDASAAFQNTYSNAYSLLHQTLGNSSSNDVEFIDPAIMAVGRGKLPLGQNQPVSAAYDSVFPMQDLGNSNYNQSMLGYRDSFSGQASPGDYDARQQLLKQKSFYANANMAASRQQLKYHDQVGDAFASYMSRQNEAMMSSRMMDQAQMHLDSPFSQISFQQPVNSTFRNTSVGTNGWDRWNRLSSTLESNFSGRRLEASLAEIGNKERMGLLDHKSGLSKIFPSYDEPKFHMPGSEDYYSRPFEM